MFCYKCGKELPDNASFCINCGASLETAKAVVSGTDAASNADGTANTAANTAAGTAGAATICQQQYSQPQYTQPQYNPQPVYYQPYIQRPMKPKGPSSYQGVILNIITFVITVIGIFISIFGTFFNYSLFSYEFSSFNLIQLSEATNYIDNILRIFGIKDSPIVTILWVIVIVIAVEIIISVILAIIRAVTFFSNGRYYNCHSTHVPISPFILSLIIVILASQIGEGEWINVSLTGEMILLLILAIANKILSFVGKNANLNLSIQDEVMNQGQVININPGGTTQWQSTFGAAQLPLNNVSAQQSANGGIVPSSEEVQIDYWECECGTQNYINAAYCRNCMKSKSEMYQKYETMYQMALRNINKLETALFLLYRLPNNYRDTAKLIRQLDPDEAYETRYGRNAALPSYDENKTDPNDFWVCECGTKNDGDAAYCKGCWKPSPEIQSFDLKEFAYQLALKYIKTDPDEAIYILTHDAKDYKDAADIVEKLEYKQWVYLNALQCIDTEPEEALNMLKRNASDYEDASKIIKNLEEGKTYWACKCGAKNVSDTAYCINCGFPKNKVVV